MLEGTIDQTNIDAENAKIKEEMSKSKPDIEVEAKEKDPVFTKEQAINAAGNVMNSLGGMMALVGAVGASVYILEGIMAFTGFGLMTNILLLMGAGILLLFISQYLITDMWFDNK